MKKVDPTTMDIMAAVANARYALEYWDREARVCGGGEAWTKGPAQRGANERETLLWVESYLREKVKP